MSVRGLLYSVGVVAVAIASFWLGSRQTTTHTTSPPSAPAEAPAALPAFAFVPAPANVDQAALEAAIRETVRSELAHARDVAGARDAKAAPTTPAQVEAEQTGRAVVTKAVAAGHWREVDRLAFHEAYRTMTLDAKRELMAILVPAINEDRVKVETEGLGLF